MMLWFPFSRTDLDKLMLPVCRSRYQYDDTTGVVFPQYRNFKRLNFLMEQLVILVDYT